MERYNDNNQSQFLNIGDQAPVFIAPVQLLSMVPLSGGVALPDLRMRKPYVKTKQREKWTDDEHQRFVEAVRLHGRNWAEIQKAVGTKTAVQIRSHAQKFFSKVDKERTTGATDTDIPQLPPPRNKRKPGRPYPRKAPPELQVVLQGGTLPGTTIQMLSQAGTSSGVLGGPGAPLGDPNSFAALSEQGALAAVAAAASAAAVAAAAAVMTAAGGQFGGSLSQEQLQSLVPLMIGAAPDLRTLGLAPLLSSSGMFIPPGGSGFGAVWPDAFRFPSSEGGTRRGVSALGSSEGDSMTMDDRTEDQSDGEMEEDGSEEEEEEEGEGEEGPESDEEADAKMAAQGYAAQQIGTMGAAAAAAVVAAATAAAGNHGMQPQATPGVAAAAAAAAAAPAAGPAPAPAPLHQPASFNPFLPPMSSPHHAVGAAAGGRAGRGVPDSSDPSSGQKDSSGADESSLPSLFHKHRQTPQPNVSDFINAALGGGNQGHGGQKAAGSGSSDLATGEPPAHNAAPGGSDALATAVFNLISPALGGFGAGMPAGEGQQLTHIIAHAAAQAAAAAYRGTGGVGGHNMAEMAAELAHGTAHNAGARAAGGAAAEPHHRRSDRSLRVREAREARAQAHQRASSRAPGGDDGPREDYDPHGPHPHHPGSGAPAGGGGGCLEDNTSGDVLGGGAQGQHGQHAGGSKKRTQGNASRGSSDGAEGGVQGTATGHADKRHCGGGSGGGSGGAGGSGSDGKEDQVESGNTRNGNGSIHGSNQTEAEGRGDGNGRNSNGGNGHSHAHNSGGGNNSGGQGKAGSQGNGANGGGDSGHGRNSGHIGNGSSHLHGSSGNNNGTGVVSTKESQPGGGASGLLLPIARGSATPHNPNASQGDQAGQGNSVPGPQGDAPPLSTPMDDSVRIPEESAKPEPRAPDAADAADRMDVDPPSGA